MIKSFFSIWAILFYSLSRMLSLSVFLWIVKNWSLSYIRETIENRCPFSVCEAVHVPIASACLTWSMKEKGAELVFVLLALSLCMAGIKLICCDLGTTRVEFGDLPLQSNSRAFLVCDEMYDVREHFAETRTEGAYKMLLILCSVSLQSLRTEFLTPATSSWACSLGS